MIADPISIATLVPRVVILDHGPVAAIDIVELPVSAEVGTEFCYRGKRWRVIAHRPRTRVLLATIITAGGTTSH